MKQIRGQVSHHQNDLNKSRRGFLEPLLLFVVWKYNLEGYYEKTIVSNHDWFDC